MSAPRPKATIAAIKPYKAGKAKAPGFARPLKLSANENPLGCSPRARRAFLERGDALYLYPDPQATALREALADRHGLAPGRLVFGAGSDEVFSLVCQAYLSPGDNIVQPHYAFAAWAIAARAAGAEVKSAPERNYTVDVDAMLAAVDARTRIVFIANPANPTGTSIPFSEVARLHAGLPAHVILVLDEAYAEFARDLPGYGDGLKLAEDAANIVVTRTFSKLHGLAALRIGWGYAPAAMADPLNRIRLPFNLCGPGQAAALAALDDAAFIDASISHAARGRTQLSAAFEALGLTPLPSAANFVTALVPAGAPLNAAQIESELAGRGILVRGLANYDLEDAFRVTVGDPDGQGRLLDAIGDLLSR